MKEPDEITRDRELLESLLRESGESGADLSDVAADQETIGRELGRLAQWEEASVHQADSETSPPGEALVEHTLRRLAGVPSPPSRPSLPRWHWWIPAAALLLMVWGAGTLIRTEPERSGGQPVLLGEDSGLRLTAPVGRDSTFSMLRWEGQCPDSGWFEVRVFDASQNRLSRPLATSPQLQENAWNPGVLVDSWPAQIRWQVRVVTPSGVEQQVEGVASR